MGTILESNCSPPSTAVSNQENRRAVFLAWLAQLMEEHGTGEYLVLLRADGSVTVKRPRKPMEFEWR